MIKSHLHQYFCSSRTKLSDWYCNKLKSLAYPIYSSYDIRDAGFKISNIDANIYPAGFNNICLTDKDFAPELFSAYLHKHYGNIKKINLLTEEHTNNPYYLENVITIKQLLESSGLRVLLSFPKEFAEPFEMESASGKKVVFASKKMLADFSADLVISNNDFSNEHAEWAEENAVPINPPRELGWYQRKKSRYFKFYNQIVSEFSQIADLDPFLLNVRTLEYDSFSLDDDSSIKTVGQQVDQMIDELNEEYRKRKINQKPFVFVKNNSGTYGLAVIRVGSGKEIFDWNYKSKKKMKAAKGGRNVDEVIIQEGIPSRVRAEDNTAEPVIYMIGQQLAGGFLRTHAEKNATESLNSPGAVYKRLCVSDLNVSLEGHPLENVYGWTARLGLLAIAEEAKEMKVQFKNFKL